MRPLSALLPWAVMNVAAARPAAFGSGTEAVRFGIYEVVLSGHGGVPNPFDTRATVTFTPPSGPAAAVTVDAFYDGGNTWRARTYVSESGAWTWASSSPTDAGLAGQAGHFVAADSTLRGRLLPHPRNPRCWITEDGRWFNNLNDTAYYLLSANDLAGRAISTPQAGAYVQDAMDRGITSFRAWALVGPHAELERTDAWTDAVFEDATAERPRLELLQGSDHRLAWLLEHFPDAYVQLILLPLGAPWGTDDTFWQGLGAPQRERLLRQLVARYAAYPQIFWLVVNDAHYGPKFPHNNAQAREVGRYLHDHDPWHHPVSTGHARFLDFAFADEPWCTYVHLENAFAFDAAACARYRACGKPVFLGEDRYENDHPDADPLDMRYFQRRLFWSWLLSGGSANYGSRWWTLQPYEETGQAPITLALRGRQPATWHQKLVGLDSIKPLRDYFIARRIELPDFEPDTTLASDADGRDGALAPKAMRRGHSEALVYHPNGTSSDRSARVDPTRQARLRLDLRELPGWLRTEWFRPFDGEAVAGEPVDGGDVVEVASPWVGHDVVLRLVAERR